MHGRFYEQVEDPYDDEELYRQQCDEQADPTEEEGSDDTLLSLFQQADTARAQ